MKKINLTLILLAAVPVAMSARRLDIYTDIRQTTKQNKTTVPASSTVIAQPEKTVETTTLVSSEPIVSTEYWDVDTYNRRSKTAADKTTENTSVATKQTVTERQTIDQVITDSYLEGYTDALHDYSTDFLYTSSFLRFHSIAYALNYYTDLDYYYDLRYRPWRFSFTLYNPFFYDPWYYDPFYYDPFYHYPYHYSYSWRYGYTPAYYGPSHGPGPRRHEPGPGIDRAPHFDRYISATLPRNPQRPNNPNRSNAPQQKQQPQQPNTGIVSRGQNVNTVGTPTQNTTVVRIVPNNNTKTTQNVNRTQQQSTTQTSTVRTTTTRVTTPAVSTTSAPRTTISVGGGTGGGGAAGGGFNAGRSR